MTTSVAIVYATRYGATETVAQRLAAALRENGAPQVWCSEIGVADPGLLASAGMIVVGGPIYAGRILSDVPKFCEANRKLLLDRVVGLFITCLYEGDQARTQLNEAFPSWLNGHACAHADLGGAVRLHQLKFLDRFLMKKVGKVREDVDRIRTDAIRAFSETLRDCLGTLP